MTDTEITIADLLAAKPKRKPSPFLRKITYHMYKNKVHEQTSTSSIYKVNPKTNEPGQDPFKDCKTLADVRKTFLEIEKEELESMFQEGCDFVLAKIDKRRLNTFQQIFPQDLVNSVKFIRGE